MLVLSRKKNESIYIGDNIEIMVIDIRGDKVRLGIKAPRHIPVYRQEIHDAIQREKQRSALDYTTKQDVPGIGLDEKTDTAQTELGSKPDAKPV